MERNTETLYLDTSQLKAGDVILNYGMRILLRGSANEYPSRNRAGATTVYHWADALVTNLEEVKAEGRVPIGWLYPDKWGLGERGGWGKDWGAEPTWAIQGNELARWSVEREAA
jgi:hypothetical protein